MYRNSLAGQYESARENSEPPRGARRIREVLRKQLPNRPHLDKIHINRQTKFLPQINVVIYNSFNAYQHP